MNAAMTMNESLAREKMILSQLMTGNVLAPEILKAMAAVPRENFVPESYKGVAYVDKSLPLGDGRYLMEPLVFARLLDMAEIMPGDHVLDIGSGCGYSSAVLAHLAAQVTAVEPDEAIAETSTQRWMKLNLLNIDLIVKSLQPDWGVRGTYNVIMLQGAVEAVPPYVLNLLAEGGRLVAVENKSLRPDAPAGLGNAVIYVKSGDACAKRAVFDASIPLMPGFTPDKHFIF